MPAPAGTTTGPRIAKTKLAERAAHFLRREILAGRFKHGDSLPSETQMMEMFSISRPTLREAVRILEAMGLVMVLRGKSGGAVVRHPTTTITAMMASDFLQIEGATLLDLQRARSMIEPELIRNLVGRIDPESSARLRDILREARLQAHDPGAYVACMTRFHTALVALLGNRVLDLLVATIHRIYEPLVAVIATDEGYNQGQAFERDIAAQEHLVSLIEHGDFVAAADHCRDNLGRIARSMEDSGAGATRIGSQSPDIVNFGQDSGHIR